MEALARQRCFNHAAREAVARCPECAHFFCRECITEHDDRVICAACLQKLAAASARPARRRWNLWPAGQLSGGFVFAWLLFYICGRLLLLLPDEFHDDRLWKARVRDALHMEPARDE